MPRVSRNYQHQDFSHLLVPQQALSKPEAQPPKQSPVIPPEKRRRDSLMSNRNMRYVLSHTGRVHDRDCPHVLQIPDDAFDMFEDFPNGRAVCFACYRKALVRRGLDLNLTKYIDAAMRIFSKAGATSNDLNTLFINHNARIYQVKADSVYLKVNEDCWIIQITDAGCMLYHNNYRKISESQRLMKTDFHLQVDKPVSFRNALITMCQYTWDGHVQTMEAKQKAQRQANLRKRLASACIYRLVSRRSLLFHYFQIAVPKNMPEQLPCRLIKRDTYQACEILFCRIPRWKAKNIPAMAESVKAYCVEAELLDYESFCSQMFPSTKEGS